MHRRTTLEADPGSVRAARRAPAHPRVHDSEAQTGHGLGLVELVSARWGSALDEVGAGSGGEGKSVWFELELGRTTTASPGGLPTTVRAPTSNRLDRRFRVCLEGVPVATFRASQEHRDGLIREFVLMSIDDADTIAVPSRLVALSEELNGRLADETVALQAQVDQAQERGDLTVDLVVDLAPGAAEAVAELVALLEEADRYCAAGALLTLAASEEVRAFRSWCAREIATQVAGGGPTPWRS